MFKLFSRPIHGYSGREPEERLKELEDEVNNFVSQHSQASVQWLQNCSHGASYLTAVVTYSVLRE